MEAERVQKAVEKMTRAYHEKDIEGVMASYENGANVVFEPETPITDAEQLREMFIASFAANPTFTYSGHEVFVAGDIAVHLAPWTMRGRMPDGEDLHAEGLSIAVLRRQANGDWLMVIDNPHGGHLLHQ